MDKLCCRFIAESKELVVSDQFSYEGGGVSELHSVALKTFSSVGIGQGGSSAWRLA